MLNMQREVEDHGWLPVALGRNSVRFAHEPGGLVRASPTRPLPPYPSKLTERLLHWADVAPDRLYMAERESSGAWRGISYGKALTHASAVA